MDSLRFAEWMRTLYGTFGKNNPAQHVIHAVYHRVECLPDSFLAYAMERLEDREVLPANLGRELYRVLWPEYRSQHPELVAREDLRGCNACRTSMPGFIWGYQADGHRYVFKCRCNDAPQFAHLGAWTPRQIVDAGYLLHDPLAPAGSQQEAQEPLPVGNIAEKKTRANERTRALTDAELDDYAKAEAF